MWFQNTHELAETGMFYFFALEHWRMDAARTREEEFPPPIDSPNIRKGRFLWMDKHSQGRYLSQLRRKIEAGYFQTEEILDRIVDEIAPAINDSVERDLSMNN